MVNSGYKQSLYWGNETSYGSTGSIDRPIGLVQSVNPTESNNLMKIRTMGGTRDYSAIVPGKFEVSGNFNFYLQDGDFLRQAFGEDTGTTTTIDSGPKVHTGASYLHIMGSAASPQVDSFPSFSMEFADSEDTGTAATSSNLHRTYDGCRVNTLAISGSVDEPVSVNVDWIAQNVKVSTAAATSVTDSIKDPFVFYQGQVYSTSGAVTAYTVVEDASKICEINSFDFNVNNNLEAIWYVSGTCSTHQSIRALKNLIVKGRDYGASLNMHFKDKVQYQRFLGATGATTDQATLSKYQIALDFTRSGTIGGTKLITDDYVRVVLGSCAFNSMNIAGAPEDVVAQNIDVFVEKAKCYIVDAEDSYSD